MKLKPKSDRILAKKIVIEEKIQGGLVLLSGQEAVEGQLEFLIARVIAVGDGKVIDGSGKVLPMDVKEGEIILYNPRQAISFMFDGEEYLTLRASECPYEIIETDNVTFKDVKAQNLIN